jgi:hypothetical protein
MAEILNLESDLQSASVVPHLKLARRETMRVMVLVKATEDSKRLFADG